MKYLLNSLLFLGALIFSPLSAQHQVRFTIHHKLGTADFALNQPAVNNLNHAFKFSRNEYYISGISIIHDQGQITTLDDVYLLVNAAEPTSVILGDLPVSQVEAVHFYVGVDSAHNHLDPAAWDPSHPLAPKFPSMHWGWVSGYRFIALEGLSGPVLQESFQLHGLGDKNYFKTRVFLAPPLNGNEIHIQIDADYTRALENIELNEGVIVHGDNLEALECLENFKNLVFSPHAPTTATEDLLPEVLVNCYPNPTYDGIITVTENLGNLSPSNIIVYDSYGRLCETTSTNVPEGTQIQLPYPGMFYVMLTQDGQKVQAKKVISF